MFGMAYRHTSTTRKRVCPRNLRNLTSAQRLKTGDTLAGASCLY